MSILVYYYLFLFQITQLSTSLFSAVSLQTARVQEEKASTDAASVNNQTTKDDIARLIHLSKDSAAQVHWC
jgi:hypothetical protein